MSDAIERFTGAMVLPSDVSVNAIAELPPVVQQKIKSDPNHFVITRKHVRTPSKVISPVAAAFLAQFSEPKTIVEATLRFCESNEAKPEAVLEDVFPLLKRLISAQLLVPADSDLANPILPSFGPGDQISGVRVIENIQFLEDTEVYKADDGQNRTLALKIFRREASEIGSKAIDHEAKAMSRLDGRINPKLVATGVHDGRPFLVTEWIDGVSAQVAAENIRSRQGVRARDQLLRLCISIAEAYVHLHDQGVVHADVHARNAIVDRSGSIKLIDFDQSVIAGEPDDIARSGHIEYYLAPEQARSITDSGDYLRPTANSEQYSIAVLLYFLITGAYPIDFSVDRRELLSQVVHNGVLPFSARQVPAWPGVEALVVKALAKNPGDRFSSLAEFAAQLRMQSDAGASPAGAIEQTGNLSAGEALLERVIGDVGRLVPFGFDRDAVTPLCSVNMGAAGIAYALYRIATTRNDPELMSAADIWCCFAESRMHRTESVYDESLELTPNTIGHVSPYHLPSGVHCVRALIGQALGDIDSAEAAVKAFVAAVANRESEETQLDLTTGMSGALLASALLLEALPEAAASGVKMLLDFGNVAFARLAERVEAFSPIRGCAAMPFLGLAHGWAGLMYALARWREAASLSPPVWLAERLFQLADCRDASNGSARWPWKLNNEGGESENYMVGWCGGSAGMIHLFTLGHRVLRDRAFLGIAEEAANNVWQTWEHTAGQNGGLGDLCCGSAGSAFGLLNFYKASGDPIWVDRARKLADQAASHTRRWARFPNSLYKGEVGVAVLIADLSRPETACMPFFEEEGWPRRA
jgi:eukaryotic-like serine/threonine-protein kinase